MKPVWRRPVLFEMILINFEIPSGPSLSIIPTSPLFQNKEPIFFAGFTKIFSYNSSIYHLFNKNSYKGKLVFLKSSSVLGLVTYK